MMFMSIICDFKQTQYRKAMHRALKMIENGNRAVGQAVN